MKVPKYATRPSMPSFICLRKSKSVFSNRSLDYDPTGFFLRVQAIWTMTVQSQRKLRRCRSDVEDNNLNILPNLYTFGRWESFWSKTFRNRMSPSMPLHSKKPICPSRLDDFAWTRAAHGIIFRPVCQGSGSIAFIPREIAPSRHRTSTPQLLILSTAQIWRMIDPPPDMS